jgi:hypothetical protein
VGQFIGKDRSNESCIRAQIANDKSKIPKLYSEFVVLFRMAHHSGIDSRTPNSFTALFWSHSSTRSEEGLLKTFCRFLAR